MKIRRLSEIDLARIGPLDSEETRRRRFECMAKGTVTNVVHQSGSHCYLCSILIVVVSDLKLDALSQLPCSVKNAHAMGKPSVSRARKD